MAYVVTDPCIQCKHTNCAAVCPVDAFREGPNFLVIDPLECIDCDAYVAECPEEAIFPDDEVPIEWVDYIELNERLAEEWADHVINQAKDPLPEVHKWSGRDDKLDFLIESWDDLKIAK
ncbi:ferredoxin family protein [Fodinibius sp. Rm-B-1B1-1]|uniref:ferredoxin family protein n=1 Tax=Fodinibius alkaliphilus TaxID=3140241 RepID=UPI00315AC085